MKNVIRNTKDIQKGENRIFLRTPMATIGQRHLKGVIELKKELDIRIDNGNIPAMLHSIILNQMVIWQKLREK